MTLINKKDKIFIAGVKGMVGSAIKRKLIQCGYQNLITPDRSELDLTNSDLVFNWYEKAKPEIVIHMAAQPLVRESYNTPVDTFASNVLGTVNVLEAARHAGTIKAIVNITTDKCYENQEWVWSYRESDRLGGHDPYSSSKACAEIATGI